MYCKLLRSRLADILQVLKTAKRPDTPECVFFVRMICMKNNVLHITLQIKQPLLFARSRSTFPNFCTVSKRSIQSQLLCRTHVTTHQQQWSVCLSTKCCLTNEMQMNNHVKDNMWQLLLCFLSWGATFVKVPQTVPRTSWNTSGTGRRDRGGETLPLRAQNLLRVLSNLSLSQVSVTNSFSFDPNISHFHIIDSPHILRVKASNPSAIPVWSLAWKKCDCCLVDLLQGTVFF